MLSNKILDNRHFMQLRERMRTGSFNDDQLIQINIMLMLEELLLSLDGVMETIAIHE